MTTEEFLNLHRDLFEHSPWVAERCLAADPAIADASAEARLAALGRTLDRASREEKLALIAAHPDLVGKAALAGELTNASTTEQQSAGLDHCSADELERFQRFNRAYHARFGFPFIMAVRGSSRAAILEAFERRLQNTPDEEFETAIDEIKSIARLRLDALERSRQSAGES